MIKVKETQVFKNDKYLLSVSVEKVDDIRLDGESWLAMYKRTEGGRIAAQNEAERLARLIGYALKFDENQKALNEISTKAG